MLVSSFLSCLLGLWSLGLSGWKERGCWEYREPGTVPPFSNPSGYESDYTQAVSGCQDNPTCFPKIWPQTWGSAWPVSPKWEQTPPSIWLCPAPRLSLQSPPPLPLFLSSPSLLLPFLPSPCLLSLIFCWKTKSRSRFGWSHIRCHTLSPHIQPSLHSHCLVL